MSRKGRLGREPDRKFCNRCGNEFFTYRGKQVYCCKDCSRKANNSMSVLRHRINRGSE